MIGAAAPYGIDTCAFLLTPVGQVRGDAGFISNWATDPDTNAVLRHSPCGSVRNSGINKDSERHASEALEIDLDQVPAEIEKITVTVSIPFYFSRPLRAIPEHWQRFNKRLRQS